MNKEKAVIVRFAPSPTGMLHIGGARTAVFNYLFARHNNGKMLLRIEDTDTQRNSQEAIDEIIKGIDWLGIDYDSDFLQELNIPKECFYQGDEKKGIILQSTRYPRHRDIAEKLVEKGLAYFAYDTPEEIEERKKYCEKNKIYYRYDGSRWKDLANPEVQKNIEEAKAKGIQPVIRLNIPDGEVLMHDLIRGDIRFDNKTQDDFVLIRSNGIPTYMLAVVCDDMDMGITHVIRGDDHISNTPKQILIYQAIQKAGIKMLNGQELTIPQFAHIPLIYDIEGKKLSKRKHAVAVSDYEKQGYLSDAIFNYLLHLGWNDGTEKEIYSKQEAIDAFDISRCGKSPSRFDFEKLKNINLHYIKQLPDNILFEMIAGKISYTISLQEKDRMMKIMPELKAYRTINEIAEVASHFLDNREIIDKDIVYGEGAREKVEYIKQVMKRVDYNDFQNSFKEILTNDDKKLKEYYPVLRTMIIGTQHGIGIHKMIELIGADWVRSVIEKF